MSTNAPTRKWWTTQVTALTALALMYVTTGSWNQEETVALIGIASQAALAWLVPNDEPADRETLKARVGGERGFATVEFIIGLLVAAVLILVWLYVN